MNLFDQYASWTNTTAKYPVAAAMGLNIEPAYLALGLADEVGELSVAPVGDERLKEAGDVLWYAARYSVCVLGIPFSELVARANHIPSFRESEITIHTGIIAGIEKKRIRDGHLWDFSTLLDKMARAHTALIHVVAWVRYELMAGNSDLEQAVLANMGKLNARLEAGTIHGDGDNR